ncbi:arabinofuranosyl transferase [Corynebacterium ulcerans]|uniref:glycosyltransferase family 87 protein n=1 Tax=Corynebacterium ulcerans TaxID=65058 RepID=UPI000C75DC27|nr:glycosyltransferase family 87 protein [Corynebacterium ulcerans]PLW00427.1 arabinofuranosyl transferase [Corynebacterium ulcerans]
MTENQITRSTRFSFPQWLRRQAEISRSFSYSQPALAQTPWDSAGKKALYPLAIGLVIYSVAVLGVNGSITDDFSTVYNALRRFLDGVPVYNETYYFVDPHYLYNPGATVLLSPIALGTHFAFQRLVFIIANAAAIIAALALLTRLFGYSLKSAVFPLVIALAFLTEAVRNTLIFSNINGVLLLAFVAFLRLTLDNRRWWAGIIIGLAIVVKPVFLPVLFIPLVLLHWQTLCAALGIPIVTNIVGWFLVPGASEYLSRTAPYLKEVRDYANSSLRGMAVYFGAPTWVSAFFFVLFAGLVIAGILFLLQWRSKEPLLWITSTASLLLLAGFFLSSLGQMYYSMTLFPLLFTVLLSRSPMHTWTAWIGALLVLAPFDWTSSYWPVVGPWLTTFQATFGWGLLIIAISVSAMAWRQEDVNNAAALNPSTA